MRQTTKAILSGDVALKSEVTVTGWVRSKRDSKSGISFLDINDGSSFDGVQVIVPSDLEIMSQKYSRLVLAAQSRSRVSWSRAKAKDRRSKSRPSKLTSVAGSTSRKAIR